MPATAAHYFFAMDVFDKLPINIKREIMKGFDEYKIGAQGPDIFFFYKPYLIKNPIRDYGRDLHHTRFDNILLGLSANLKDNYDDLALAYLLGMITHFVFDKTFHPIINKEAYTFDMHMIIEKELDRYLIYKKTDIRPTKFKRHLLVKYDNDYYHKYLKLIYPELDADISYKAIKEMYKNMELLYSPNGIKKEGLKFIFQSKLPIPYDYSNMIIDIDDAMLFQKTIQTLDSIWDKTVEDAKDLIINYWNFLFNNNELSPEFNYNFGG